MGSADSRERLAPVTHSAAAMTGWMGRGNSVVAEELRRRTGSVHLQAVSSLGVCM